MTPFRSEKVVRPVDENHVRIRSFCSPEEIRRYAFDDQFGTHAHYKSLYTRRESLEKNASQTDANVVLAVTDPGKIVGFGVLAYPDPEERWAQLEPQVMMEVKALEVSRSWRRHHIAPGIVEMMLSHPLIEEKIAYFVGYSWTWDLDGTGFSAQQYRRMMIRLFEPYGFQEFQTNEPNICLKPENIFMGRIGARVSPETRNRFKWLRFGISEG
jgi:acetoin utilization protein AcuA